VICQDEIELEGMGGGSVMSYFKSSIRELAWND